jgi:Zn-dependent peptidase ImmA (M78 family)
LTALRGQPILAAVASLYSNRGAKRAREARGELGLGGDGPPADLVRTVEERAGAHVVVLELPDGVAGAYAARPGRPLLFVNGRQAISRQRFTLAHELGHHRMGHDSVVDEEAVISGHVHDPQEVCANAFAAEFLMPREGVKAWAAVHVSGQLTLEHVVVFANEFGVSPQAARYAFATAGVIADDKRAAQLDGEIADELHIELTSYLGLEPLEDRLAEAVRRLPRIPPALEHSALGDLLVGAIGIDELAARTGHSVGELEDALAEFQLDRLLPGA